MPYFEPIGQAVAEIWPFFDFSRWRPSAILNLEKFEILTTHTLQIANVSPCQISLSTAKPLPRYDRLSTFQDGGRPPSWLCYTRLDHPQTGKKSIWWSLSLCKIWFESVSVGEN